MGRKVAIGKAAHRHHGHFVGTGVSSAARVGAYLRDFGELKAASVNGIALAGSLAPVPMQYFHQHGVAVVLGGVWPAVWC